MNEMITNYLHTKKEEVLKERSKILIDLGLYEKVYNDANNGTQYSDEYPEFDYKVNKYYKKVSVDCTDEEFEEILKYANTDNAGYDVMSRIFKGIAIAVYIIGFIIGIVLSNITSVFMFIAWIIAFLIGTSYYGFGQIITLLFRIYKK